MAEEGELVNEGTVEAIQKEIQELQRELARLQGKDKTTEEEGEPQWVSDGGYVRVEDCCLYYHTATGCYYESITGQFLTPTHSYEQTNKDTSDDTCTHTQTTKAEATPTEATPIGMTGDIASQLAAVSDHVTQSCGFVYDESSGLYYDTNTGLYYDQTNRLYYDADNGTYYSYDYSTKQYMIHSHVELPSSQQDDREEEGRTDCIIQSDPININDRVVEEEKVTQLDLMFADEETLPDSPPPVNEWPSCIRMIPQEESTNKLKDNDARNCISLITVEGATIGRDVTGPQSLRIIDLQVSKHHAEIIYQKKKERFVIKDLGSVNGTFINEKRLSEPKEVSQLHFLQHGDILKFGVIKFTIHIHNGMNSCTDCSQLKVSLVGGASGHGPNESLETQRRKGLNEIKKKYGLRLKDSYGDQLHKLPKHYTDKAEERRRNVGSDLPLTAIKDDVPSSVDRPISESNLGNKMLRKLGWKEGESLGAINNSDAITEPIQAYVRAEKTGLGYSQSHSMDDVHLINSRQDERHDKLLKRYNEASSSIGTNDFYKKRKKN